MSSTKGAAAGEQALLQVVERTRLREEKRIQGRKAAEQAASGRQDGPPEAQPPEGNKYWND